MTKTGKLRALRLQSSQMRQCSLVLGTTILASETRSDFSSRPDLAGAALKAGLKCDGTHHVHNASRLAYRRPPDVKKVNKALS